MSQCRLESPSRFEFVLKIPFVAKSRGTSNTAAQDYTDYIRLHPQVADGYALRARAYGYMGLKTKQDIDTATANSLR
jgi:hypothetical protein